MSGKGSKRRKEDTRKVQQKLCEIDWTKHKSKSNFKMRINGKDAKNGVA